MMSATVEIDQSQHALCLSVRQPWANLLVAGIKDVENRTWKLSKKFLGRRIQIHASKKFDAGAEAWIAERFGASPEFATIQKIVRASKNTVGGIVGSVVFEDASMKSESLWAQGPWYFRVRAGSAVVCEIVPMTGRLGIWSCQLSGQEGERFL